jgi:hypothetical protein
MNKVVSIATIGELFSIFSGVSRLATYLQMLLMMASFRALLAKVLFLSRLSRILDFNFDVFAHIFPIAEIAAFAMASFLLLV